MVDAVVQHRPAPNNPAPPLLAKTLSWANGFSKKDVPDEWANHESTCVDWTRQPTAKVVLMH